MFALDLGIHEESARTILHKTNDFSEIPKRLEEAETIFMTEISDVLITIHKEYDLLTERRRRYKELCNSLDENARLGQTNRAAGANIVKLNCGGKNIDIGRQTILSTPEWNLLSALLSGRWDKHLLKDNKGRIYMDYDAEWMSPILNLIRESTISVTSTDDLILPPVMDEKLQGFNSVISFFGLDPKRVVTVPKPYACVPPSLLSLSHSLPPPAVIMSSTRDVLSQWIISALSKPISIRNEAEDVVNDGTATITATHRESSLQTLNWDLIYKGSRDGFDVADFQRKCSGKRNTVVIVTDTVGNVFGGFVEVPLVQSTLNEHCQVSEDGFLFSLHTASNPSAKPAKASLKNNCQQQAVFYSNRYLFCLGSQPQQSRHPHHPRQPQQQQNMDFCLSSNMSGCVNVDNTLQQRGRTFALDPGSDSSHTMFIDEKPFAAIEVEVYTVEKNFEAPPAYEREINRSLSTLGMMPSFAADLAYQLRKQRAELQKKEEQLLMELRFIELNSIYGRRGKAREEDQEKLSSGLVAEWMAIKASLKGTDRGDATSELGGDSTSASSSSSTMPSTVNDDEQRLHDIVATIERLNAMASVPLDENDTDAVVTFNVGGTIVCMKRSTLLNYAPDSYFSSRFSGRWTEHSDDVDEEGYIFQDKSPEGFLRIMSYLRLRVMLGHDPEAKIMAPKDDLPSLERLVNYYSLKSQTGCL